MGLQYDRSLTLTVGGSTVAEMNGDPDNCLRVTFQCNQKTMQSPNKGLIKIYNTSGQTASTLINSKQDTQVQLMAGYVDNPGLIYQGELLQARKCRETPTDTYVALLCADGQVGYSFAVTNVAIPKGSTPMDQFKANLEAMKQKGITEGYVTPGALDSPKYPRGVTLSGMSRFHLTTLAHSYMCHWSIQNGQLNMIKYDDHIPGEALVLNSATGLIGMPEQTAQGVRFQMLINPALQIDKLVQIDQSLINPAQAPIDLTGNIDPTQPIPETAADGMYRVYWIDKIGDTRGVPWYFECYALPAGGYSTPVPSQALQALPVLYEHSPYTNFNGPSG